MSGPEVGALLRRDWAFPATTPVRLFLYVAPPAAAAVIGAVAAYPSAYPLLLVPAAAIWLLTSIIHWRVTFVALFLFLPLAAVPGILLQQQGWPTLLKDGLFLLPGYVGMSLYLIKSHTHRWPLPPSVTVSAGALAAIVIVQAIRVLPTSPLVALIGLRSWLLYVPLIFVPSIAVTSAANLRRIVRLVILVSLIPAAVGVLEFALILLGHPDVAYQWYGALAAGVSQNFASVGISNQLSVSRVPSTFTFVTQFVAYCLITTPICVIAWMSDPERRWRRVGAIASVAIVAAGFGSGSRTFYMWGPIEIAFVLLLMRRGRLRLTAAIGAGIVAGVLILGSQLIQIATFIVSLGWQYLAVTNAGEFPAVYNIAGLLGVGAGLDTNGSRYVLPSQALPFGIEGWYALAFLELGLPGLILIVITWLALLRASWIAVRLLRGTTIAPAAIGCFVILLATVLNLYKGESLEYDPLNVYFWATAGLVFALPRLIAQTGKNESQYLNSHSIARRFERLAEIR